MNPDDLTDEKIAEYAAQFEDLPEKVILVEMLAEVKAIRVALTQDRQERQEPGADDAPTAYVCQRCPGDRTVAADKRERHARSEHNCPPGEELTLFEPVE